MNLVIGETQVKFNKSPSQATYPMSNTVDLGFESLDVSTHTPNVAPSSLHLNTHDDAFVMDPDMV